MATSLPVVISPLERLFQRDGVDLVLVSVEVWSDEVVVRLRGLPTQVTEALDGDVHTALNELHRQDERGGESLPVQPAERTFDFALTLSDDVGTTYFPAGSAVGGSGQMFRADWFFKPGTPRTARSITVRMTGAQPTETEIRLDRSE